MVEREILTLKTQLQKSLVSKTSAKLNLSINELGEFIINHIDGEEDINLQNDETLADKYGFLLDYTGEELEEILGFDKVKKRFVFPGIQFSGVDLRWCARGIMEELGYTLSETIDDYPNAHNTDGIILCDMI